MLIIVGAFEDLMIRNWREDGVAALKSEAPLLPLK
jgi:hypothetical protein